MKTGVIRDFIVEKNLEEELLSFAPKSESDSIRDWLNSEDLEY